MPQGRAAMPGKGGETTGVNRARSHRDLHMWLLLSIKAEIVPANLGGRMDG